MWVVNRKLGELGLLFIVVCLAGCSVVAEPIPTASGSPSPVPVPSGTDALYGKDAISLSEFVVAHPDEVPPEIEGATFLVEGSGVGPTSFAIPGLSNATPSLLLAIFCDGASSYDLTLLRSGEQLDRTWGDSCPTSGMVTYQTAPIAGSASGLELDVTTGSEVSYRIAVLQVPETP